ncbi:MAG: sulfite exporter TauE/SafE family protein [Burkholderiaceae bacterium]
MTGGLGWQGVAELLLLGSITGFLAGLFGIGGGMLMVPFTTLLLSSKGMPPAYIVKMAIATSLATICFTSVASVRAHHGRGAVLWPVARLLAPGIVLGSLLGAQIAKALPSQVLAVLLALVVSSSAAQMLIDSKPTPSLYKAWTL